jgi:hypothetical protein
MSQVDQMRFKVQIWFSINFENLRQKSNCLRTKKPLNGNEFYIMYCLLRLLFFTFKKEHQVSIEFYTC